MAYQGYVLEWSGSSTGGWKAVTEAIQINEKTGIDQKTGIMDLEVANVSNTFSGLVPNDVMRLYYNDSESTAGSVLVFYGDVTAFNFKLTPSKKTVRIKVTDQSRRLMNNLHTNVYDTFLPGSIIISMMADIQYSKDAADRITANWIGSGGSVWPGEATISKAYYNRRVYQILEDLSVDDITQDGNYIFYVDSDRYLHYEPKSTTFIGSIVQGDGNVLDLDVGRDLDKTKNAYIIYCGTDQNENAVYTECHDTDAIQEANGEWIWDYKNWPDIMERIKNMEPTGTNAEMRASGLAIGSARAMAEFDGHAMPQWQAKAMMKGTASYNAGNLVNLTAPMTSIAVGNTAGDLYVTDIKHQYSEDGWTTTLNLKEEYESVSS